LNGDEELFDTTHSASTAPKPVAAIGGHAADGEVTTVRTATNLVEFDVDRDGEILLVRRTIAKVGVEVLAGRSGTGRSHGKSLELFRTAVGDHDHRALGRTAGIV